MSENNVVLTFDGDFKAFQDNEKKPLVDLDIDASATNNLLEIEFDDQINKTQYYAQIPLEGPLDDDMALDILKIRPTDVTHIDLIDQLNESYPCNNLSNTNPVVSKFNLIENKVGGKLSRKKKIYGRRLTKRI